MCCLDGDRNTGTPVRGAGGLIDDDTAGKRHPVADKPGPGQQRQPFDCWQVPGDQQYPLRCGPDLALHLRDRGPAPADRAHSPIQHPGQVGHEEAGDGGALKARAHRDLPAVMLLCVGHENILNDRADGGDGYDRQHADEKTDRVQQGPQPVRAQMISARADIRPSISR